MAFERGQRVEIINHDKGFENSFYPAVVISQVSDKKYIIQYSTLYAEKDEDDEFKPIREFRKEEELRPVPPEAVVTEFVVGDKVDAYHQDGWWSGRIRRVQKGETNKYFVYFAVPREYLGFKVDDLRIQQVWSGGQWSRS